MNMRKPSAFYSHVKTDLKLYSNMACILEKVESDGHLQSLGASVASIFAQEISFAIKGRLIRAEETQGTQPAGGNRRAAVHQYQHLQGKSEADHLLAEFAYQSKPPGAKESIRLKLRSPSLRQHSEETNPPPASRKSPRPPSARMSLLFPPLRNYPEI